MYPWKRKKRKEVCNHVSTRSKASRDGEFSRCFLAVAAKVKEWQELKLAGKLEGTQQEEEEIDIYMGLEGM